MLIALYVAYLWLLLKVPPHAEEAVADAPAVSRWAYGLGGRRRVAAIAGLFVVGGLLLYFAARPFLESHDRAWPPSLGVARLRLRAVGGAVPLRVPGEGLRVLLGAARGQGAHGADEHGLLQHQPVDDAGGDDPAGVRWSHAAAGGGWVAFHFDAEQQLEIALTLAQSLVAMLLLMEMAFDWWEASGLFLLWLVQFGWPGTREVVTALYLAWAAGMMAGAVTGRRPLRAPRIFLDVVRESRRHRAGGKKAPRA